MLTIRLARSNDADGMTTARREAICWKGTGYYQQSIVTAWANAAATDRVALYTRQIADADCIVLVAEAADEIMGFAIANLRQKELNAIYVKPNGIGRVGSGLLSHAEHLAFAQSNSLSVVAALSAVAFYEANGYVDEGLVFYVDSNGTDVPCRMMRKTRVR